MKLLVDMNLSPRWVEALQSSGIEARHWSAVGDAGAPDTEIFAWSRRHGYVVFTNDLDFARLVALADGAAPSVVLLRTHRVLPDDSARALVSVLREHRAALEQGAVVVVHADKHRVRWLPLRP